jgi:hypothetical protein
MFYWGVLVNCEKYQKLEALVLNQRVVSGRGRGFCASNINGISKYPAFPSASSKLIPR